MPRGVMALFGSIIDDVVLVSGEDEPCFGEYAMELISTGYFRINEINPTNVSNILLKYLRYYYDISQLILNSNGKYKPIYIFSNPKNRKLSISQIIDKNEDSSDPSKQKPIKISIIFSIIGFKIDKLSKNDTIEIQERIYEILNNNKFYNFNSILNKNNDLLNIGFNSNIYNNIIVYYFKCDILEIFTDNER